MSKELTQEQAVALAVKYAHFPEGKIPALVECWVDGNDIVRLIKDVYAEAYAEGITSERQHQKDKS